jgi:hypothetical protein
MGLYICKIKLEGETYEKADNRHIKYARFKRGKD